MKSSLLVFGLSVLASQSVHAQSAVAAAPAAPIVLRLKWKTGQKFSRTVVQDVRWTQIQGVGKDVMESRLELDSTLEVLAISAEGNTRLRLTVTRIGKTERDLNAGKKSSQYSRWSKADREQAERNDRLAARQLELAEQRAYAVIKGRSLDLLLSDRGRILEVSGDKELYRDILRSSPTGNQGDDAPDYEAVTRRVVRSLRALYGGVLWLPPALPEAPVALGGSWEVAELNDDYGQPVRVRKSYAVTEKAAGRYTINVLIRSLTTPPDSRKPAPAFDMNNPQHDISYTGKGSLEIDEFTGWTTRTDFSERVKISSPEVVAALSYGQTQQALFVQNKYTAYSLSRVTTVTTPIVP